MMMNPKLNDLRAEASAWPVHHCAGSVNGHQFGDVHREFYLASVTKLLTARAVLVSVEEGALDLDTVVQWDPHQHTVALSDLGEGLSLSESGDKPICSQRQMSGTPPTTSTTPIATIAPLPSATVRQLLSHSGGVAMNDWAQQRQPGTRRMYSSAGYEILAGAVEHATAMPFREYLHEAVCEPLQMTSTRLEGSAGYAGVSTVADLEKFAAEMCNPMLIGGDYYGIVEPELKGVVPGYGMFSPCPWALGPEVAGTKPQQREHWMGHSLPPDTVGHFGQAGTFLWVVPGQYWTVVLTDRDFGPWAKPLWSQWNTAVGEVLAGR